jgi:hypothetical protein
VSNGRESIVRNEGVGREPTFREGLSSEAED